MARVSGTSNTMRQKVKVKKSDFWFWARHLGAAAVLSVAAVVILTLDIDWSVSSPGLETKSKDSNSISDGLSKFYSELRSTMLDGAIDTDNQYIINLPPPKDDLVQHIEEMGRFAKSKSSSWKGSKTNRHFRQGETLKGVLEKYAAQENISFVWWLERDYVIKHYFVEESQFTQTLAKVAVAITPDYNEPVIAFFCPAESTVVLTHKVPDGLGKRCKKL